MGLVAAKKRTPKPVIPTRGILTPRQRRERDMGIIALSGSRKPVAQDDDPPSPSNQPPMTDREKKIHRQAIDRFNSAESACKPQDEREKQDLGFFAGDINYQWDPAVVTMRQGENAQNGMPAVPARPCLVINTVKEPIIQVMNQERQADLGIQIVASNDFGDELASPVQDEEIEVREGLVRRIQRESEAKDARTWAFSRAVQAGTGYYAVRTRYVNDKNFDQEVYVERIYNQSAVRLDPGHVQPDGSDCDWEFIGTWMPWDAYRASFPKSRVSTMDDDTTFEGLQDTAPGWFSMDGEERGIRVVDYFWTEHISVTLKDGDLERTVDQKKIWHTKMNGLEPLAETEWPSPFMPIVKVTGNELHPYDRERRIEGMVRPARDSARGTNFMASRLMEAIATAPLQPYLLAEGQAEGYEDMWQAAATRVQPFVYYKQTDLAGQPAPPPQRLNSDAPIQNIASALTIFRDFTRATTGVPAVGLGEIDPALKSGKAIKALLEQAQRGTSNYLDNLIRSVSYEGKIINSLLKPIYDNRPGRLIQIVTGNGENESRVLGAPFVMKNGRAVPPHQAAPGPTPPKVQNLSLSDADFHVEIVVSKAYDTRREQEAAELGDIIQADPQLMAVFGDLYFKAQDGPGAKELSDRMKLMLAPPIQAALKAGATLPPEAASAVAVLQGQLQQAMQQLQQAEMAIKTKQIEQQADLEKARMDNATKVQIAEIQAAASMSNAQAKVDAENLRSYVDALEARIAKQLDLRLKLHTDAAAQMHDASTQAADHAHEAAMATLDHAHTLQQAQQAAALAPQTPDTTQESA